MFLFSSRYHSFYFASLRKSCLFFFGNLLYTFTCAKAGLLRLLKSPQISSNQKSFLKTSQKGKVLTISFLNLRKSSELFHTAGRVTITPCIYEYFFPIFVTPTHFQTTLLTLPNEISSSSPSLLRYYWPSFSSMYYRSGELLEGNITETDCFLQIQNLYITT